MGTISFDMNKSNTNVVKIKIKYQKDEDGDSLVKVLGYIDKGDWIDLRTSEVTNIYPGGWGLIPLGVCIELPKGYEGIMLPRSSTFKRFGILMSNSMGIIDNSYSGDEDIWRFPYFGTRSCLIPKNTRIAQFRIQKNQERIEFTEVTGLGNTARGGFGSTG